jgi:hypothetical protein
MIQAFGAYQPPVVVKLTQLARRSGLTAGMLEHLAENGRIQLDIRRIGPARTRFVPRAQAERILQALDTLEALQL